MPHDELTVTIPRGLAENYAYGDHRQREEAEDKMGELLEDAILKREEAEHPLRNVNDDGTPYELVIRYPGGETTKRQLRDGYAAVSYALAQTHPPHRSPELMQVRYWGSGEVMWEWESGEGVTVGQDLGSALHVDKPEDIDESGGIAETTEVRLDDPDVHLTRRGRKVLAETVARSGKAEVPHLDPLPAFQLDAWLTRLQLEWEYKPALKRLVDPAIIIRNIRENLGRNANATKLDTVPNWVLERVDEVLTDKRLKHERKPFKLGWEMACKRIREALTWEPDGEECQHDSTRADGWLDEHCLRCGAKGYWQNGRRLSAAGRLKHQHPSGKTLVQPDDPFDNPDIDGTRPARALMGLRGAPGPGTVRDYLDWMGDLPAYLRYLAKQIVEASPELTHNENEEIVEIPLRGGDRQTYRRLAEVSNALEDLAGRMPSISFDSYVLGGLDNTRLLNFGGEQWLPRTVVDDMIIARQQELEDKTRALERTNERLDEVIELAGVTGDYAKRFHDLLDMTRDALIIERRAADKLVRAVMTLDGKVDKSPRDKGDSLDLRETRRLAERIKDGTVAAEIQEEALAEERRELNPGNATRLLSDVALALTDYRDNFRDPEEQS